MQRFALSLSILAFAALAPAHAGAAETAIATSTEAAGLHYAGGSSNNSVRFTLAGSTFTVDDIVPIQAGTGCKPVAGDATKVTCIAFKVGSKFKQFNVFAGGGNDNVVNQTSSATTAGAPMRAEGGSGNDVLTGDAKADDELRGGTLNDLLRGQGGRNELDGGSGDDKLEGGSDTLRGGLGRDQLFGGASDDLFEGGDGADRIDGGPAGISAGERHDRVDFSTRSTRVSVDLAREDASQGAPGEGDTILHVEDISGGRGNDLLFGNQFGNLIDGGAGDDGIGGAAGKDVLTGGDGNDAIFPSPTTGFFSVLPDGEADSVDCGGVGGIDGDPGDLTLRVLADGDLANDCAQVIDVGQ